MDANWRRKRRKRSRRWKRGVSGPENWLLRYAVDEAPPPMLLLLLRRRKD